MGKPNNVDGDIAALAAEADKCHAAGNLAQAETIYRRILEGEPRNVDILHRLGLIALQTGNTTGARQLFERCIKILPNFADAYCNLGLILSNEGAVTESTAAYQQAIALNPAMAEAHAGLGTVLQGAWHLREAVISFRNAVAIQPNLPDTLNRLGATLLELGERDEAKDVLTQATQLQPGFSSAHCNLGCCYRDQQDWRAAEEAFKRAVQLDAKSARALIMLAGLYENLNRLDEAYGTVLKALDIEPGNLSGVYLAAKCERRLGNPVEARNRLESISFNNATAKTRGLASFELAGLYERAGEFEDAYSSFAAANQIFAHSWEPLGIDGGAYREHLDELSRAFTADWVSTWSPAVQTGTDERVPHFFMGFPRSGTTLLEQILDAHPDVTTLEELPLLESVTAALDDHSDGYPWGLAALSEADIEEFRAVYRKNIERFTGEFDPDTHYIDKLPLAMTRAGLIHRLYPQAKIILAARHPCDCCLSAFKQPFQPNPAMAQFHTLEGTIRFYVQVMNLWSTYTEVLPLDYVVVRYENLVTDHRAEAGRVLDHLGLSWQDELDDYLTRSQARKIGTPSYHQVTQPIYKSSIGQWENYRPHFEPYLTLLEPFLEQFGYEV